MKKSIFGAVILSAALAVGTCMPAFAVEQPSAGSISSMNVLAEDAEGANTTISVTTHISQINVALPLALPIVADQAGGAAITPNNYYIQNLTRSDLKITDASWAIVDDAKTGWNLSTKVLTTAGTAPTTYVTGETNAGKLPEYGTLFVSLEPKSSDLTLNDLDEGDTNLSGSGVAGPALQLKPDANSTISGSKTKVDWTIGKTEGTDKPTQANGNKMYIKVNASSSTIAKAVDSDVDVIKIIYTVAAA